MVDDESRILRVARGGRALLSRVRSEASALDLAADRGPPPGSPPRRRFLQDPATMPDPPAASSSSTPAPKAIPNLAKRASETTRRGTSRLVFLPTKPATRRKE